MADAANAHVVAWYAVEDRAAVAALEVQACNRCGAILWRRAHGTEPFPAWRRVGDDCPGAMEDQQMAKKSANGGEKPPRKKRPAQGELPGTEDSAIAPLENAAKRYAAIRDERIELNVEEAKLKANLIVLMHKHGKTVYRRHKVEITLVPEAESVKVKIKSDSDSDDDGGDE